MAARCQKGRHQILSLLYVVVGGEIWGTTGVSRLVLRFLLGVCVLWNGVLLVGVQRVPHYTRGRHVLRSAVPPTIRGVCRNNKGTICRVGGITLVVNSSDSLPVMAPTIGRLGRLNVRARIHIVDTREAPGRTRSFTRGTTGGNFNIVVTTTNVTTRLNNILTTSAALPIVKVPYSTGILSNVSTVLTAIVVPPKVPITAINMGTTGGTTLLTTRVLTINSSTLTGGLTSVHGSVRGTIVRGSGTVRRGVGRV